MDFVIHINDDYKTRFEKNGWELPDGLRFAQEGENDLYNRLCAMFRASDVIEKYSVYTASMDFGSFIAGDGISQSTHFVTKRGFNIRIDYNADDAIPFTDCSCDSSSQEFIDEIRRAANEYYRTDFEICNVRIMNFSDGEIMYIDLCHDKTLGGKENEKV